MIARSVSRVRADEVDGTPSAFFADSPSLVSDRLTQGQIRTSQAEVGTQADQAYLASISTSAVINEADQAYEAGQWSQALVRDALVQNERRLANRIDVDGVGWRDNIIGSGTDDSRDSLDRRVEFKVKGCK